MGKMWRISRDSMFVISGTWGSISVFSPLFFSLLNLMFFWTEMFAATMRMPANCEKIFRMKVEKIWQIARLDVYGVQHVRSRLLCVLVPWIVELLAESVTMRMPAVRRNMSETGKVLMHRERPDAFTARWELDLLSFLWKSRFLVLPSSCAHRNL